MLFRSSEILSSLKTIPLFLGIIITAIFCLPGALENGAFSSLGIRGINKGYSVFSLTVPAPWTFVGFEVTVFDTAHFKFHIAKSKWLIVFTIVCAAFAYAAMALVGMAAVPDGFTSWQQYIENLDGLTSIASVPTFYAVRSIMGPVGLVVMTLTAAAAILTGIIGGYRATTRVHSTMAEDNILSERFSKTTYSILFIMVISIILALLGRNTLGWFVNLTSFGAIIGFGYTSAAAWRVAATEGNKKAVITGSVRTIISSVFIVSQLIPRLAAMEAMPVETKDIGAAEYDNRV